jgi:RimJ/RimL family protein N-acetyltransferase
MRTIETERLVLRKFTIEDFEAVQSYASCVENIVYMLWGPNSAEQTREFIEMAISQADEEPCKNYQYAAVLRSSGKPIGACNLVI